MPLATIDDLEARLPAGTITEISRAEALLEGAAATVKAYTGQSFESTEIEARLRVRDGKVRLPQRPVTGVESVENMSGGDVSFSWDHGEIVFLAGAGVVVPFDVEPFRTGPTYVDVTYTAGYETVPAVIVDIVCQIAARAYGSPAHDSGVTQESIDDYSYTRGVIGAAGVAGLLPDERRALDQFRRGARAISMWPA